MPTAHWVDTTRREEVFPSPLPQTMIQKKIVTVERIPCTLNQREAGKKSYTGNYNYLENKR